MGVCCSTSKKGGGLRHRHNPKRGSYARVQPKKGLLRHGHESKRGEGGLRHGHESKGGGGGVLRTGLVKIQSYIYSN